LHTRLLCIRDCIRIIGFELCQLQVQSLKVQFRKIASFQTLPANVEFVLEVIQVIVGKLLRGLCDDKVGEGLAH
jgi:hypothetical protein